ncbi:MAG: UDP-N-acetylmuramoyl-tripeptide--D-alanyl-D-alanine ligase [Anaerolineae bacterium]|nr:UDP-N-acetylmuramoyl-tripeptide--D-alanyl-D-alanine ligase [Anaerolineae bacterium]
MTETVLTVRNLVAALAAPEAGVAPGDLPSVPIVHAVVDSRAAVPGCLFVALRGERHDGHEFISQAIEKGAVAVIAERPDVSGLRALGCRVLDATGKHGWDTPSPSEAVCIVVPDSLAALQQVAAFWRRKHEVRVVGITGSIGKTMTKEMTASVLSRRYATLKSEGNYNNEIGLPLTLLHLAAGHERVVLEMGMYDVGEIAALAHIALPQVGVVTNVGPSHLERLGTMERIALAKAELPQALPPAARGGVAILNADDDRVRAMAGQTQAQVVTYGLAADADVRASDVASEGLEGIRFRIHHAGDTLHVRVPLLGRHSVHTALAATAVGLVEGLDWAEVMEGLHRPGPAESTQLRLVAVPGPAGSTILDDTYNASPASTTAALTLLHDLARGSGHKRASAGREAPGARRAIAVLGEMYELGSYEEEGHRLVGRRARDVADVLVVVGRLGQEIGRAALASGMPRPAVHMVEDNAAAIKLLRDTIRPGDLVLVKGSRGMGMEEIVNGLSAAAPELGPGPGRTPPGQEQDRS